MTPAQASKLRGLAQWTDSEVMGRPARSCLRLVAARQYGSGSHLSDSLRWALRYLLEVAKSAEPRSHHLPSLGQPAVIIFTDAAEEPDEHGKLKISCGFVIHGKDTVWGAFGVPDWVVESWEQRKKHIAMGELLVVPVLAMEPQVRPC